MLGTCSSPSSSSKNLLNESWEQSMSLIPRLSSIWSSLPWPLNALLLAVLNPTLLPRTALKFWFRPSTSSALLQEGALLAALPANPTSYLPHLRELKAGLERITEPPEEWSLLHETVVRNYHLRAPPARGAPLAST